MPPVETAQNSLDEQMMNELSDAPQSEAPQTQTPQTPVEYEYKTSGKIVKEPIDVILQRAGQGYNYAQRMQELNQQVQSWEAKVKEAESIKSKYAPIEDFAAKNPGWNEHINEMWAKRQGWNPETQTVESNPLVDSLNQKISSLEMKLQEVAGFISQEKAKAEDSQLSGQIESIRKTYPDIDFTVTDPTSGKSREMQVLEHMQKNGIANAVTAFRDLFHDQIVQLAVSKALGEKTAAAKADRKNGIIARSATPQISNPVDVGRMDDRQLFDAMMNDPIWDQPN